jgi:hypothetical protein
MGEPGFVSISLSIGAGIYWWKAAEIYDASGRLLGSAWCKRDEGVVSSTARRILTEEVKQGGYLVFKKAKALGVHTSFYVIRDLASKDGRNLAFTWTERD